MTCPHTSYKPFWRFINKRLVAFWRCESCGESWSEDRLNHLGELDDDGEFRSAESLEKTLCARPPWRTHTHSVRPGWRRLTRSWV